ncbi:CPXV010 protein [Cowpox virus]|uniref:CPXV010 protein n=1 Tax=Cowpox virus TaxID=10243 RepID=A0A212PPD2_COWPX|nr:CPXV010 protein [Cowpox virus]SPN68366.1 CPXV010 protein [Cowpox virus]SPN68644.1 CPXV010 protein [Cowpox virus]
MDDKISNAIKAMNNQEVNRIIKNLDLQENSTVNDVITNTCNFMRDGVLTKLFFQEFIKYMPFSVIVAKTQVRGFYNLVKEYLRIVRNLNIDDMGPVFKEFTTYEDLAIEKYGKPFIRDMRVTVLKDIYDSDSDSDSDMDYVYNIDLYTKLKQKSDGTHSIDPVQFTKTAIGVASIISKTTISNNTLDGYPVFCWNISPLCVNAFLSYLETKVVS